MNVEQAAKALNLSVTALSSLIAEKRIVCIDGNIDPRSIEHAARSNAFLLAARRAREAEKQADADAKAAEEEKARKLSILYTKLKTAKEANDHMSVIRLSEQLLDLEGVSYA